jgi:thiol-disulfide isomerase/thioredoxin
MKRFVRTTVILIGALLILLGSGCGRSESSGKKTDTVAAQKKVRERFVLKNIYGKPYSWSQFLGKPFMINFWATWCGPCRAEIPALKKLYAEYNPQGLEIVAISVDDIRTETQVVPFIDRFQIPWLVLYGDDRVTMEFNPGPSIPVTLFFDANGNEVGRFVGAQPESVFRQEIEKLFPKQPQS